MQISTFCLWPFLQEMSKSSKKSETYLPTNFVWTYSAFPGKTYFMYSTEKHLPRHQITESFGNQGNAAPFALHVHSTRYCKVKCSSLAVHIYLSGGIHRTEINNNFQFLVLSRIMYPRGIFLCSLLFQIHLNGIFYFVNENNAGDNTP